MLTSDSEEQNATKINLPLLKRFQSMAARNYFDSNRFNFRLTVLNATFNNISVTSWRSVLLVECFLLIYLEWCYIRYHEEFEDTKGLSESVNR
jgi:hypothetical protein